MIFTEFLYMIKESDVFVRVCVSIADRSVDSHNSGGCYWRKRYVKLRRGAFKISAESGN